jgi:hypothetical protein
MIPIRLSIVTRKALVSSSGVTAPEARMPATALSFASRSCTDVAK